MIEKIDIKNTDITKLDINKSNIEIITVAKVGTAFFSSIFKKTHHHDIDRIDNLVNNNTYTKLIISGIRNPIDRNISYFFETSNMNIAPPKLKINNYKYISDTFVCNNDDLNNMDTDVLINIFFQKKYHNTFNIWFEEFFDITKIDSIDFDIEQGIQLYKINEHTYILFYVLEKLDLNINIIKKFLNYQDIYNNYNNTKNKKIADRYIDFKKKINIKDEYKQNLLNTDIMKKFYSEKDINGFYNKYIYTPSDI